MLARVLTLIGLSYCALAGAQTPPGLVGAWKVVWVGDTRPQEARLVITETGGTWKTAAFARNDRCVGLEVPISVEAVDGDAATVRLRFGEVLAGCADTAIRVWKLGDDALGGTRGRFDLTITRTK